MGQRSIVQFNHDCSHIIAANPTEFIDALMRALASGDQRYWDDLKRWGVRRIVQHHHSDKGKVVLNFTGGSAEYEIP